MAITSTDIHDFFRFALSSVDSGSASSVSELAACWEAERERLALIADVEAAEAERLQSATQPAAEAIAEIRRQLRPPL